MCVLLECSTLYQAFQFAFGHETDASKADVTVTLQGTSQNATEILEFRHTKTDHTASTFAIKAAAEDDNFEVS